MSEEGAAKAAKPCPICGRPPVERYKPFCSARCANIDLGRWLNESYRIPAAPGAEEDEAPPAGGDREDGEEA